MRFGLISVFGLTLLVGCTSINKEESGSLENEAGPYVVKEGQTPPPAVVGDENYKDPLEVINRPIFAFNDVTYRYFLTPLSRGYENVVPTPVDRSIRNFFNNLREPLYFVNYLFQGRLKKSAKSISRFAVNSTMGLLGLFDPAQGWLDLEKETTTLGETLAFYGVGYGFYVVIPLLGPSNLRDGVTMSLEYYAHPLNYIEEKRAGRYLLIFEGFVDEVPRLSSYPEVVEKAKDKYIFIRNFYLQNLSRDTQVLRGIEFDESQVN